MRDRYIAVMESPQTYGDAAAASLCREHASLNPIAITLIEIEQKDYWPAHRLRGKQPLDPEFVNVNTLKTVPCPEK